MSHCLAGFLATSFVIVVSGCAASASNPVLPDGSHRVPINRAPAGSASHVPPLFDLPISLAWPTGHARGVGGTES
jgi:hypothetical protein